VLEKAGLQFAGERIAYGECMKLYELTATRHGAALGSQAMNSIPCIRYRDAAAAIDWLERAFGYETTARHEDAGVVHHAELRFGDGMLMLGSSGQGMPEIEQTVGSACIYLVVDDADAAFERARAAGAEVLEEPQDRGYTRDFTVRDLDGNIFSVGTYRPE
jgi:uncharacterized glyoxalase superfamily protein PhnB